MVGILGNSHQIPQLAGILSICGLPVVFVEFVEKGLKMVNFDHYWTIFSCF